jgi:hypothetical protein
MRRPRGIALVTVLLMLTLLVIIMVALFCALRGENFLTLGHAQRTAALYAAEAGVAVCQANLESDNTWQSDIINQSLPGGEGTYTVRFSDGSSVNNLTGNSPLDGPRGPGTVLAGTADITIYARSGIISRTLEVILGNASLIQPSYPLTAGGTVQMLGNVNITGVAAAGDASAVPAGVFSNNSANKPNIITWSPLQPGDKANISGVVGTVSSNGGAVILAAGGTASGGIKTGMPPQNLPNPDIVSLISSNSSAPRPTIMAVGATQLGAGSYYVNGDVTTNGDLQLGGANLYINGKLTVNGSITGTGSVYVASSTTFNGDSQVSAGPDNHQIALYSHGDVTLSGFNGTAWLNAFTQGAGLQSQWTEVKTLIGMMNNLLATTPATPQNYFYQGSPFDHMGDVMGHPMPAGWVPGQASNDPLWTIEQAVDAQPSSPTQQFIATQLKSWIYDDGSGDRQGMFRWHASIADMQSSVTGLINNGSIDGVTDGINDLGDYQYRGQLQNKLAELDPNHLGQAYFRGLVYTDGSFNAVNEVSIQGALVAGGNINLSDGTDVMFVNHFFGVEGPGLNKVAVRAWLGR